MLDRLQRPFLTVETGEAYQPIRLTYKIVSKPKLEAALNVLQCLEKAASGSTWTWFWRGECDDQHFESLDSFRKNPQHPLRLGTFTIRENKLYINLPSFKRACLAVPFFYKHFGVESAIVSTADFINKVFALDERLPHGFTELFKEDELNHILRQRVEDFHKVKEQCEVAPTAEQAFTILSEFTKTEAQKKLPYAERYSFETSADSSDTQDPDVLFLAFYIFLRGRELVAIKRWYGQSGYNLSDAADEVIEQVFGGIGIDIIE